MKSLVTILFLTVSVRIIAQIDIINQDVTVPDSAILFSDFPNHVYIDGLEDLSRIGLSADNGMIRMMGGGRFIVWNTGTKSVTLNVLDFSLGDPKKIFKKVFSVEAVGDTTVKFVPASDTVYSNGQRYNRTRLEVLFSNANFSGNYEVAHFELSVKDDQGKNKIIRHFVSGPFLGVEILDKIKAHKGRVLTFEQIILKGNDTRYSKYRSFTIQL